RIARPLIGSSLPPGMERYRLPKGVTAQIIGGPVVLDSCIVLAVGKSTKGDSSPTGCAVYEFPTGPSPSDLHPADPKRGLEPISIVQLPRPVKGAMFRWLPDRVVWACEADGFVRIAVNEQLGFGWDDRVMGVDWYRRLPPRKPDAWPVRDAWL